MLSEPVRPRPRSLWAWEGCGVGGSVCRRQISTFRLPAEVSWQVELIRRPLEVG